MAWGSVGNGGTASSSLANQASLSHVLQNNALSAGRVGVIIVAQDNASSINSIDGGVVSTVTDAAGNQWIKAKEWQNGGGAAQGGAVCSLWYTQASNTLSTGQAITITFLPGSSANFDDSASSAWIYTIGAGSIVSVAAATANITNASSVIGSLDQTVTTLPALRVRGIATESTTIGSLTTTANWSAFLGQRTGANNAMGVRGEFLITTSSTAASAPTIPVAADNASVFVVFQEIVNNPLSGGGAAEGDASVAGIGIAQAYGSGSAVGDSDAAPAGPFDLTAFE